VKIILLVVCSGQKTDKNVPFRMKWVFEVGLRWHDQQVG
jgi:hypothetical protein